MRKLVNAASQISKAEIDLLRGKITDKILKSPKKAAIILAGWLSGNGKTSKNQRSEKPAKKKAA